MYTETELAEYVTEIREQVCSRCIERPPGGPPCAPLGKECGIELHLPEYIEAIHGTDSLLIEPYLDKIHQNVCSHCFRRGQEGCPCPMDYLLVLLADAVETVDRRRAASDLPEWTI